MEREHAMAERERPVRPPVVPPLPDRSPDNRYLIEPSDTADTAWPAPDADDLIEASAELAPSEPFAMSDGFAPADGFARADGLGVDGTFAHRDVRPVASVTRLPIGVLDAGARPAARDLTTFAPSTIETQQARLRLAQAADAESSGVAFDPDASGAEFGAELPNDGRDPRNVQIAGNRHSARHQAARTEIAGLHDMLRALLEASGSDLHLTTGAAPTLRVHGDLQRLADHGPMAAPELASLLAQTVDADQWQRFTRVRELDFAYTAAGIGRFRVNLYQQRGGYGAAFRAIPRDIPELATLGLPAAVEQFAHLPRGLVLVTGPTGSGKSTTLASLLALANRTRRPHIVTIEDPIEFVHEHGAGLVNQREVGSDTESFAAALTHALRQDPDVILVGELRDLETTATALTAAETGHLVFATLHTQSAAQTIDRIIDIFPTDQQGEVRAQLSTSLRGVVTQALCPRADRPGRAVVTEIMVATPAIRNLIREGKTHQIPSFMQAGGRDGMLTFDQNLAELVRHGVVDFDRALSICHSPEELGRLARGAGA